MTDPMMMDPVLLVGVVSSVVSSVALVLRTALVELRWWLALRGTLPAQRPAIIRALRCPSRTVPRVRIRAQAAEAGPRRPRA